MGTLVPADRAQYTKLGPVDAAECISSSSVGHGGAGRTIVCDAAPVVCDAAPVVHSGMDLSMAAGVQLWGMR